MQISNESLDLLFKIQELDLRVIKAKKERAQLPQRLQLIKLRKKRAEIEPKLDQIEEVLQKKNKDVSVIKDEETQLSEKSKRLQEEIDQAGTNFRLAESHSRDMAGIAKRKETLQGELKAIEAEISSVTHMRDQILEVLKNIQEKENEIIDSFKDQDAALVTLIKDSFHQKELLAAQVPDDVMLAYNNAAEKCGGVGLAELKDNSCSACRTPINETRMTALKAESPVSHCPFCGRLIVVDRI